MSLTSRALWTIDRNLGRELSLAEIAQACGVSRHHLAHSFSEAAGRSVMDYVRARRLSEAARALAGGAGNILELALESGYASHEAFSRAFRARFGVTPETVRRRGATDGLALQPTLVAPAGPGPSLEPPRLETAGEILAAGLGGRCAFDDEASIPAQWRRFEPELGGIGNRVQPIPIGVMMGVDEDGRFDYLCACELRDFSDIPPHLTRLRIPPQAYVVFQHRGHVATIRQTYAAIWNWWLPEHGHTLAEAPSVERHGPRFDPLTGLGGLELWVPLTSA